MKLTEDKLKSIIKSVLNEMNEHEDDMPSADVRQQIAAEMNSIQHPYFNMDDMVNDEGEDAGFLGVAYDADTNELYAGWISNSGASKNFTIQYDPDFDLDQNLDALYEKVTEELMNDGYHFAYNESKTYKHIRNIVAETVQKYLKRKR